ncbi:YkgJ family cysteine cluster protein [Zunongwangia endophytica]|uniref:YkgJ family cysteine cluster protein n=1 Tax=Zunongwangia endophytica TaxID=1808945 RepID=A0ABV8H9T0_9FLAO|nr:YkgJ family cysteine cluster protein [Zunongwangia endophytica]MDN3593722.1 YkgJ family cysteine cluster protein [Zunongwangia endophytica]
MKLEEKVRAVESLFETLSEELNTFQAQAGFSCGAGCGKCCEKPGIQASPLEFLPWALQCFLDGKTEDTLEALSNTSVEICHNYKMLSLENSTGRCTAYAHRGLVCRLFGYAAQRAKNNKLQLISCKLLKQSENFSTAAVSINNGLSVPVFSDYYLRLAQIDFGMGRKILPINKALKIALEEVLQYYSYRPVPKNWKRVA